MLLVLSLVLTYNSFHMKVTGANCISVLVFTSNCMFALLFGIYIFALTF
jgi:hypothetical protein